MIQFVTVFAILLGKIMADANIDLLSEDDQFCETESCANEQMMPGWRIPVYVRNPSGSSVLQQFMNLQLPPDLNKDLECLIKSSREGTFQFPGNFLEDLEIGKNHLERHDMRSDAAFYESPRFVTHIDESAIESLSKYYRAHLNPSKLTIVDICSSWISHLPEESNFSDVIGIGMNEEELKANKQLTKYHVHDLNKNPKLKMLQSGSIDAALITVSVDYLIRPFEVFSEVFRILRPGGAFIVSFSNRMFPTKVIKAWLHSGDPVHLYMVAFYFQALDWEKVTISDITTTQKGPAAARKTDPMYVLHGIKPSRKKN